MNIQLGKVPLPAAAPAAARSAPPQGASGARESAMPQPSPQASARPQDSAQVQTHLSADAVRRVASQINDFLKSSSSSLQFSVDGDTSKVVVRIVDSQTNELIRQIPSEEMIAISKSLDQMTGLLIKQKA